MRTNITCCAFILCSLLSSVAWAQGSCTEDKRAQMLNKSKEGDRLFGAQKYEAAAEAFTEAHFDCPSPILAKNMTIAWYKADRCDKAIQTGVGYVILGQWPESPSDGDIQDHRDGKTILVRCNLKLAEAALEKKDLDAAKGYIDAAKEQVDDKKQRPGYAFVFSGKDAARLTAAQTKYTEIETKKDIKDPDPPKKIIPPPKADPPILAYTLIGVGGVGVLASLGRLGWHAGPRFAELEDELTDCQNQRNTTTAQCNEESVQRTKEENDFMTGVILPVGIVGGVLAGVGTFLLLTSSPQETPVEGTVRLLPVIGPDQTGVQLHWTF